MTKKKKILVYTQFFYPGFKAGGPIKSLLYLANELSNSFEFSVVCSCHDDGEKDCYQNVKLDKMNQWGSNYIYYVSRNFFKTLKSLTLTKSQYDIIYLQSFFSFKYSILVIIYMFVRRIHKPVIIAPRGEINPGALQIKSFKKKIYLFFFKTLSFHRRIIFHSTNEKETMYLKFFFGPLAKIVQISNLSDRANLDYDSNIIRDPDILNVVFLSRIAKMKNLHYALEILKDSRININFDILGPISDKTYWNKCQNIMSTLPSNIKAKYKGPIEQKFVHKTLAGYDLFFLPTLGENFGHAIAESLSVGTPVLISNKTPWKNLQPKGLGWDISLNNNEEFNKALEKVFKSNKKRPNQMREKVRVYVKNNFNYKDEISNYRDLFNKLI